MERIAVQRAGQTLERSPRTPGVRPSRQPAAQTSMMDGGLLDTRSGGIKAPVSPRLKPAPASPASAEKAPERFVGIVGEIALYLSSDTLLLVDRQRAATLITYHRLLARSGGTPLPRPLSIKLNAKQRESLSARSETLSRLGFELNAFGEGSHLLARAPEALSGESAIQWLGDYLSGADGDSQGPAEWTMAQTQSAETWETVNAKALYEATLLVVPEGEKDICTRLPQSRLKELCP